MRASGPRQRRLQPGTAQRRPRCLRARWLGRFVRHPPAVWPHVEEPSNRSSADAAPRSGLIHAVRRLPARAWILLRRAGGSLAASAGTRDAAQLAFFAIVSFPAVLLMLVWGFSTALDDATVRERIVDSIVEALPLAEDAGRREVEQILDGIAAGAGGLGWIGAASLAYSASGGIAALRHAVNDAWGTPDTRPYVPGKALDVGLTLIVAPTVIVALGLNLSAALPAALGERPLLAGWLTLLATDVLPAIVGFIILTGLFRVLPSACASIRTVWPGALVAVVALPRPAAGGFRLRRPVRQRQRDIWGHRGPTRARLLHVSRRHRRGLRSACRGTGVPIPGRGRDRQRDRRGTGNAHAARPRAPRAVAWPVPAPTRSPAPGRGRSSF